MQLLSKQENAVYYLKDNITNEILYGGAAGGGKSALGCLWLIEMCQTYPGTRWLMGRAKLKTLKETTLNTFFQLSSQLGITEQFEYKEQKGCIQWNNGSEILLKDLFFYPSDPEYDQLGSLEITGAFIDECNQIQYKAWQIVKSRIRYMLNVYDLIPKIFGSCNPAKNWVYSLFYKPNMLNKLPEQRKFIQALPTDNPHLPKSYLESLLQLDINSRQRLYYGNWDYDDDPTALISYEYISNIFTNSHIDHNHNDKYLIADIARYGSDKAIITVWYGLVLKEYHVFDVSSTVIIQQCINAMRSKHGIPSSRCLADDDGVGGGVVDNCGIIGFKNGSSPIDKGYNSLKDQCGYKLSEKIKNIYFEADLSEENRTAIESELGQLKTYQSDKDGKMRLLPKEKIKEQIGRSPDWLDCFIMRMYFEIFDTNVINQAYEQAEKYL